MDEGPNRKRFAVLAKSEPFRCRLMFQKTVRGRVIIYCALHTAEILAYSRWEVEIV